MLEEFDFEVGVSSLDEDVLLSALGFLVALLSEVGMLSLDDVPFKTALSLLELPSSPPPHPTSAATSRNANPILSKFLIVFRFMYPSFMSKSIPEYAHGSGSSPSDFCFWQLQHSS
ncbi:MAG: hypothetical protein PHV74_14310 [Dehalococcoidia bacterium]|nr:hypothetical protein [Dehalococcoidia bacterium]